MPIAKDQIDQELERLRTGWPMAEDISTPAPHFSWSDWQDILLNLTHNKQDEMLVRGALGAIMRQASTKPGYLVHEDLIVVAIATHTKCWDFPWVEQSEEGGMP